MPAFPGQNGADDPTRTDDLLITSELLYQLSYVGPGYGPLLSLPRRPSPANDSVWEGKALSPSIGRALSPSRVARSVFRVSSGLARLPDSRRSSRFRFDQWIWWGFDDRGGRRGAECSARLRARHRRRVFPAHEPASRVRLAGKCDRAFDRDALRRLEWSAGEHGTLSGG